MSTFAIHMSRQQVTAKIKRIILTLCVALIFSVSFLVMQEPAAVYAAPNAATGSRYDRRPDRERPMVTGTTSQGSNGTTSSNGSSSNGSSSTGSSSGTSSQQPRPRLVRR